MSRFAAVLGATLALSGCAVYDYERYPEPRADRMEVDAARRQAETRCPGGILERDDRRDGTSPLDWKCIPPGRN